MEMSLEQIWSNVLQMPIGSRAVLAKRLLDSLEPDQDPDDENELIWAQEAERRFQEILDGRVSTKPASVVMQAARERSNR